MKRIFKPVAIAMLSAIFFISCTDSGTPSSTAGEAAKPAFDLAAAKTAIEGVITEYEGYAAKADSVNLAALYTSDAKLMMPNMPIASGRSNIQSVFAGMFNAMGQVGVSITTIEVWGDESAITEEGTYTMTDKDGKQIDSGKYLAVWKMEDGKWKMYRDCGNSDLPCQPASSK